MRLNMGRLIAPVSSAERSVYILAHDLGTSADKASLFDAGGIGVGLYRD